MTSLQGARDEQGGNKRLWLFNRLGWRGICAVTRGATSYDPIGHRTLCGRTVFPLVWFDVEPPRVLFSWHNPDNERQCEYCYNAWIDELRNPKPVVAVVPEIPVNGKTKEQYAAETQTLLEHVRKVQDELKASKRKKKAVLFD